MRKAVIQVGDYVAKEGPTGGWRVYPGKVDDMDIQTGKREPVSAHEDKADAIAAAKRYQECAERRARWAQ